MSDFLTDARRILLEHGIDPGSVPDTSGTLTRCGTTDKPHSKNGAYILHVDAPASLWWQNWRTGESGTHTAKAESSLTNAQRAALRKRIDADRLQREEAQAERHAEAATKAALIWESAAEAENHPYLEKKGVPPYGLCIGNDGRLIVPVFDERSRPQSLQFISEEGEKRFLTGGKIAGGYFYIPAENGDKTGPLLVAEGYATSASLHMATGYACLAAFNAGNLLAVAQLAREKYPQREIALCADNDVQTPGNPGLTKATEAATAIGAKLTVCPAHEGRATDFNDLHQWCGLEAVRGIVKTATCPDKKEPIPLPDLPSVLQFDFDLIPETLRPWIQDNAERLQCPPEYLAVAVIVTLATVLGRKIAIRPKRCDDWTVICNMWAMLIGKPSLMKSPAIEAACIHMNRLIAEALREYEEQKKAYDTALEAHLLQVASAKDAAKKELKKNPSADVGHMLKLEPPQEPVLHRYSVSDCTNEVLAEIMRMNPNGILGLFDELVALLGNLDGAKNPSGRALYLTAWNGNTPHVVDRIGRGQNLRIEAACLSVLGSTQPARICSYVRDSVAGGSEADGLLQRFGMMVWPDVPDTWEYVDRWPDTAAKNRAFQVFDRLDKLTPEEAGAEQTLDFDGKPDGVPFLRYDEEAQGLFVEWLTNHENRLRNGGLHPAVESHLTKYRKLVPALSLILYLADGGVGPVTATPLLRALGWAELLETHAHRIYSAASAPEMDAAKSLLAHIQKGDMPEVFRARDVRQKGWAGLSTPEDVQAALDVLVEYRHLIATEKSTTDAGGRPTVDYRRAQ